MNILKIPKSKYTKTVFKSFIYKFKRQATAGIFLLTCKVNCTPLAETSIIEVANQSWEK